MYIRERGERDASSRHSLRVVLLWGWMFLTWVEVRVYWHLVPAFRFNGFNGRRNGVASLLPCRERASADAAMQGLRWDQMQRTWPALRHN